MTATDTTPARPDLDEIEARADAATPGPWRWHADEGRMTVDGESAHTSTPVLTVYAPYITRAEALESIRLDRAFEGGDDTTMASGLRERFHDDGMVDGLADDTKFIAHARTDVPALAAYARHLEQLLADALAEPHPVTGEPQLGINTRHRIRTALGEAGA